MRGVCANGFNGHFPRDKCVEILAGAVRKTSGYDVY
jgi:hypothetical protein